MKRLFPALCALLFVGGILACLGAFSPADGHAVRSGGPNPPRFSGYSFVPITLAADSADTTRREIATTPSTRSDFAHDSLSKPIRILAKNGDTTGKYVPREMIMRVLDGYTYTGRDSVFEFVDTLCIKWFIRLPATKEGHVRVYAIDTCETECRPQIGDQDRIYGDACDSLRIIGYGPQVTVQWGIDPLSGLTKDLQVKVDTVLVPAIFSIYTSRGAVTTQQDSANKWFVVGYSLNTARGFPLGTFDEVWVRSLGWTTRTTSYPVHGGSVNLVHGASSVTTGTEAQLMVRWVTNPASRTVGNNKTKLSFYTGPLYLGGFPDTSAIQNIGIVEIDDDVVYGGTTSLATAETQQWVFQLTVWLLCIKRIW